MKYFLNALLLTSMVLFTLGCIDEHEKKEALKESRKETIKSQSISTFRVAQGQELTPTEIVD